MPEIMYPEICLERWVERMKRHKQKIKKNRTAAGTSTLDFIWHVST
jgi:hypothetical protein